MHRIKEYSIEEVFGYMSSFEPKLDGRKIRKSSDRLLLFKRDNNADGIVCVKCGLHADFFSLETHDLTVKPHLNLYARGVDGAEDILFTKDHITPKSLGGLNELDNYQVMCEPCNSKKANKYIG